MSSRGLRVLTLAKQLARAAGVSIRLALPTDVMREILAISRYDKLFPVDRELPAGSAK
jgi:anti-anti-sigma regulatory factor